MPCLLTAPGTAEATRVVIKYEVARAGAVKGDFREFAYIVDAVLNDPRLVAVGFGPLPAVKRGGRFAVTLAAPRVVGRLRRLQRLL